MGSGDSALRVESRTLHFEAPKDQWCWSCCASIEAPEIVERPSRSSVTGLLQELFKLQDLNSNGWLEESELIELNEIIAVLHHGDDIDRDLLRKKYRQLYRQNLEPSGQPVSLATFQRHMLKVLAEYDADLAAQEMIVEQFIAEAQLARSMQSFVKNPMWDVLP